MRIILPEDYRQNPSFGSIILEDLYTSSGRIIILPIGRYLHVLTFLSGTQLGRQQCPELDLKGAILVIADVLSGNSSLYLVICVAGFSWIRAFRRYQTGRKSIMRLVRYWESKI